MKHWIGFLFASILVGAGCQSPQQAEDSSATPIHAAEKANLPSHPIPYADTFYVPVYSDIYSGDEDRRFQLTVTLSVRNTSLSDSLFVTSVDYYNTQGNLVRKYLADAIVLRPMETQEFLVKKLDVSGGSGANFIVSVGGKRAQMKPMVQAVMISTTSRQGLSFTTEGISISALP